MTHLSPAEVEAIAGHDGAAVLPWPLVIRRPDRPSAGDPGAIARAAFARAHRIGWEAACEQGRRTGRDPRLLYDHRAVADLAVELTRFGEQLAADMDALGSSSAQRGSPSKDSRTHAQVSS